MIRLSVKDDWQKNLLYFKKMKHAKKFMAYFDNLGCNLPWEITESDEFPEMDSYDENEMERKPKKRAKDDEDWALDYIKLHPRYDRSREIAETLMKGMNI